MSRQLWWRSVPVAVGLSVVPTPVAQAATTEECTEAHAEGQRLRNTGALTAAREQLLVCNDAACPGLIQGDCAGWLQELKGEIPSISPAATGPDGDDAIDVRLFIDGELVLERLDGRSIDIDPGPHQLRFEMEGQPPIEKNVVIQQGVGARSIRVSFAPPSTPGVPAPAPTTPAPELADAGAEEGADLGWAVAGWVSGALALGSFGAFVGFGVSGVQGKDDLEATCGATPAGCTDDDRAPVETELLLADVFLGTGIGVGAASIGMLVYYYVSQPEDEAAGEQSWSIDVAPTPGGAAGALRLRF